MKPIAIRPIQLFCTFTRTLRTLEVRTPGEVSMYCCGPTVYDYVHIGNLRTYLCEDFLRRTLEVAGYKVNHITNITDVGHLVSDADEGEDKMEKGAKRTGLSAWQIAEKYTLAFENDIAELNILPPSQMPRATNFIPEQIELIQKMESKGFCYTTSDGVYFDTAQLPNYGELARLDLEGLQAGQRVDLADKRNKTDFALWKFSHKKNAEGETPQRQMEWESPWGIGFPGWHIECTAMSVKILGEYFDIHWGGEDHIPVHHTNEIAQCQAAYGTREANFWLHTKFLTLGTEKMSKSKGGFLRVETLKEEGFSPFAYRYLCLGAHYRAALEFTWENLRAAETALNRLFAQVEQLPAGGHPNENYLEQFFAALCDDLGTAQGLALAWKLLKDDAVPPAEKRATLLEFDRVLGLSLCDPSRAKVQVQIPQEALEAANARKQARDQKDWAAADKYKAHLLALGFEVLDKGDTYELRKKV